MVHAITWNRIALGIAVLKASAQALDLLVPRVTEETDSSGDTEHTDGPRTVMFNDLFRSIDMGHLCTSFTLLTFGMRGTSGNHAMGTRSSVQYSCCCSGGMDGVEVERCPKIGVPT